MSSVASLQLPADGEGLTVIASVSGGKDSTALILALREAEIQARYVFADTAWEADETYGYLDTLRDQLGITIDVVGLDGGMLRLAREKAGFPMRRGRWCTEKLKLIPLRAYHDEAVATGIETISAVGIRAQESEERAAQSEWVDDGPTFSTDPPRWGGYIWRPLLKWSVEDVLLIHRRHDLPVNPLYHRGHDRVGCYPCILSTKEDIRLVALHAPQRIAQIREVEAELSAERARRNESGEGDFKHSNATFFQTTVGRDLFGIDRVIAWSKTERGGRKLSLFPPTPKGGCMKWGLSETSPQKAGEP